MTKYGWPQVAFFPLAVLAAMLLYPVIALRFLPYWARLAPWALLTFGPAEFVLLVLLVLVLAFFRDPNRTAPADENLLLSPADGRITDIEIVDENDFIRGPALRIGIFLTIFDVHINRAPCSARVERITYRPGKYGNAMNPRSGRVNESNDLGLTRTDRPQDRLIVRQISGAIARRIVCAAGQGQKLAGGEKFGMIKFGSRTELYLPARGSAKCLVRIGDKVKAGLSPLVRYEGCPD
ncbi:MAG: phosphatidylserine decarboxylase [Planctomycetota bacterium]